MTLISVVSAKGGQGKSTLSNAIAFATNGAIVTNELHSSMDLIMGERFKKVASEAELPELNPEITVIFDGAQGIHQRSTLQAVERADYILIPVKPEGSGMEELKRLAWGLGEVPKNKTAVVVMKVVESEYLEIKAQVQEQFPEVKVFWMPNSHCFEELGDDRFNGQTLHQKSRLKGPSAHRLRTIVLPEFEALMNYINLPISK